MSTSCCHSRNSASNPGLSLYTVNPKTREKPTCERKPKNKKQGIGLGTRLDECMVRVCNCLNFGLERARARSVILKFENKAGAKEIGLPRNFVCIGQ